MKLHSNILLFLMISVLFLSCLTPQKMDAYVAEQYGDRLPQLNKKNTQSITVTSQLPRTTEAISLTTKKTSNVLPLIIYWHFEFRRICHLNPDIPVINFTNALNSAAAKPLLQKLEGKKLELTVEQAPVDFSHTEKSNTIIIASWTRLYMEPDFKDLVVSYKLINADSTVKTGKIQIENPMRKKGFRMFQTWKSAISEFIAEYNVTINSMTKSFATELMKQL